MQLFLSHELQAPGARNLAPDELRGQMEERFSWAVGRGLSVCALVSELLGLECLERQSPGLTPRLLGAVASALGPAFRVTEVFVQLDQGRLVVVLVGPDPTRLEAACREWVASAKELRVDGEASPLRVSLRCGYGVTQPGKRLFLDTLIQVAREGLRVALCRAPGACVHTLLYDVLQNRFELERGTPGIAVTASAPLHAGAPGREPAERPELVAPGSGAGAPSPQPRAPVNGSHERQVSVPLLSDPAPAPGSALTDPGRRERELTEALAAQLRENDGLRARLQALEARDVPASVSRGAQEPLAAPGNGAQDRIDLLERRVTKLRLFLAETEERLAMASRAVAADSGIASIYRTVQGLEPDAPDFAQKASLMEKIFAANLALHEQLRHRQA